jgi:hypothetical protein
MTFYYIAHTEIDDTPKRTDPFEDPRDAVQEAFNLYGPCICDVLEYEKTHIGLSHDYRKHRRWEGVTALPTRLNL